VDLAESSFELGLEGCLVVIEKAGRISADGVCVEVAIVTTAWAIGPMDVER
jgi:hypothetical protein